MSNIKKNSNTKSEWFQKPWTKLTASIIGISTIFGLGYTVGTFKENLDWKLEKIILNQEFNEKLQKQIDDCKKTKIEEYQLSAEEIERVANELKKRNNEK